MDQSGLAAAVVIPRSPLKLCRLSNPPRLVPCHIEGRQPQYLLVSGLVFTVCVEPYLSNEYGPDYGSEAPVKLLDRLIHGLLPESAQPRGTATDPVKSGSLKICCPSLRRASSDRR